MATEKEDVGSTENTEGTEVSNVKKYLSWEGLETYDGYIKGEINNKASSNHDHDDKYYTINEFNKFTIEVSAAFDVLDEVKVNEDGFNDRVNNIINSAILITEEDIDDICGATIEIANDEVKF